MDENGYMMGIAGSSKALFSNYQKQTFINKAGNWEWTSLIETIGTTSCQLLLFVILKDKRWKNDWYLSDMERDARISLSKNGSTNNKLCMKWIRNCVKPETRVTSAVNIKSWSLMGIYFIYQLCLFDLPKNIKYCSYVYRRSLHIYYNL